MPSKDQFSGCLIGQCRGDAVGFPVEACLPHTTAVYVEKLLRRSLAGAFGRKPYVFGQYTDDSQLARTLMESYAACAGFDPADYARRIAALFTANRIVGPGGATSAAAYRLAAGVPWNQAGTPPPAAGNGSAMRAGPIGLFFAGDPARLIEAARDQGRITHQGPRCSAGAVAIAGAVALAAQSETIDAARFLKELSEWTRQVEPSVADAVSQLAGWVALTPEEAVRFIAIAGLEPGFMDSYVGISSFVVGSVLWSLYSFLRTPDDYWETICTAISPGGDVDTTAAMAGAISGAHRGLAAIPAELARRLTDQGSWGYAELVALAERCYQVKRAESGAG